MNLRILHLLFLFFPLALESFSPKLPSHLQKVIVRKGLKLCPSEEASKPPETTTSDLTIDLRNPSLKNGTLTTSEGGVIKNTELRIQAQKIAYTYKKEKENLLHYVVAEGNLLLQYKGRVYSGKKLFYDFEKKQGTISSGKTFVSPWYLGGETIELQSDGSYKIKNAFLTTCENEESSWDLRASEVDVQGKNLLYVRKVRFRFFKIPALWFPSFKINLQRFLSRPLLHYKIDYDKKSGPRISLRYQAFSWNDFLLFLRLDYRLKMGFGGAVETEYFPQHKKISFATKNYLASDILPNDLKKRRRYRIQGAYHFLNDSEKTSLDITWDKFSDIDMPGDFKSEDFEINTAKRTELLLRHEGVHSLSLLHIRPRVNSFETIRQDLPSWYTTFQPLSLGSSGIIFTNFFRLSYLDFAYSDHLQKDLSDFHSGRIEVQGKLFRPFIFSSLTFTPQIGGIGILYSKGPEKVKVPVLGCLHYGFLLESRLFRSFKEWKHMLIPYLQYKGLTSPTISSEEHYIFSLQDGFHSLNQLQVGIKNRWFSREKASPLPLFTLDLYANVFLCDYTISKLLPKGYLDLAGNFSSFFYSSYNCWNFQKNLLDFSNSRIGWTFNENAALSFEFRHRSSSDWRKANRENFILDVTRSEEELLDSPLSDRRNTFLTRLFFRFNPLWNCQIESHHGWGRQKERGYNEWKIDLFTFLSAHWKVRFTYQHTEKDDRLSAGIILIKR